MPFKSSLQIAEIAVNKYGIPPTLYQLLSTIKQEQIPATRTLCLMLGFERNDITRCMGLIGITDACMALLRPEVPRATIEDGDKLLNETLEFLLERIDELKKKYDAVEQN